MNIWYLCFRQGFPGISNLIRANPNGPHPVDPEGSHPVETDGPHPFESRKDPVKRTRRTVSGRNSSGSGSHQGRRPRTALIRSTPTGQHPVDPDWPSSGRSRSNPERTASDPHPVNPTDPHPDKPTWPYPGKFKQTPAYSSKLRTNTSEPSR